MEFTVENLAVARAGRDVVAGVNFSLSAGDALRLCGANGVGKSTLLRALAGILPLSAGGFRWGKERLSRESHAARLHWIGHAPSLTPGLSVSEQLVFFGTPLRAPSLHHSEILSELRLAEQTETRTEQLSAGQARRLSLARLCLAPRALWLLDEPAASLDAQGLDWLRCAIKTHRAQGGMVILATHDEGPAENAQTLWLQAEEGSDTMSKVRTA